MLGFLKVTTPAQLLCKKFNCVVGEAHSTRITMEHISWMGLTLFLLFFHLKQFSCPLLYAEVQPQNPHVIHSLVVSEQHLS